MGENRIGEKEHHNVILFQFCLGEKLQSPVPVIPDNVGIVHHPVRQGQYFLEARGNGFVIAGSGSVNKAVPHEVNRALILRGGADGFPEAVFHIEVFPAAVLENLPAVLFRNSGTFKSFDKPGNAAVSDIVRKGLQVLLPEKLPGLSIGHIEMPAL